MSEAFDYGNRREDGQYEHHPSNPLPTFVAPLRNEYIHLKCGTRTLMPAKGLILTYATNPSYYGRTFCANCGDYFVLSEFVWCEKGERTEIKLGEIKGEPGIDLTAHGTGQPARASYIS